MTQADIINNWSVIAALKEGKVIQFRRKGDGNKAWQDTMDFTFNGQFEYRIKPEPREWFLITTDNPAEPWTERYLSMTDAEIRRNLLKSISCSDHVIVHVKELPQ